VTAVEISTGASATAASSDRPVRVAVVIPCYNDGAFVPDAVRSVHGARGVQVVVVDDGSTDLATQRALDDLTTAGITIVRQQNAGPSAARMAGMKAVVAPYIYNLDADDLGSPEAIETMADRLDDDTEAVVCYGDYEEFGDLALTRLVPQTIDPYRLAYTNEYPVTALFRRSVLEAVGGWQHIDEKREDYEDWHLWMTLAERGHQGIYAGSGVITFRRRVHDERRLAVAKANHLAIYRTMREVHPHLFGELATHRRASSLSQWRKLLYPLIYGGRRRFRFERRVKAWLDRAGIWTLRG
jgi:glycosyltransferase involved in cell wall biosynthesis